MSKEWLRGKTILIISILEGIDRYLIYDLIVKYNCKIYCVCENIKNVEGFEQKLEELKTNVVFDVFNITEEKNWEIYKDKLMSSKIVIDVLININEIKNSNLLLFEELSYSDFLVSMSENFFKTIFSIKHIIPILNKSRNPSIITILNLEMFSKNKGLCNYNSSAMAVKCLIELLSKEIEDIHFGLIYIEANNLNNIKNKKTICSDYSKCIIKAINKKRRVVYVGLKAKTYNYINKFSKRLSEKVLKFKD